VLSAAVLPAPSAGVPVLVVVLILLILLILAAIAATVTARRVARSRRRIAWQLEAHPAAPEGTCQERSRYCQKTQIKVKPGRREIAYLELYARIGDRDTVVKRLDGEIVRMLSQAVRAHRRHERPEELQRVVLPAAALLVAEVEAWLAEDATRDEVRTQAHLIAAEIEFEFTLYRCTKTPRGCEWQSEDKWNASLEDEQEEDVAELQRTASVGAGVESALTQLTDFVARVDERASVEVSVGMSAG
jgi:hypothetical protein